MELISMSQYNTANESKIQSGAAMARDDVYSHRTKKGISKKHDKIVSKLFFSLAKAKADGIKTDHSPSNPNMRTLDIYQVQQLIQTHCGKLITHMEIIDALHDLTDPELMKPSTIAFDSELDGKRISAIRLIYNCSKSESNDDTKTDDIALELSQVTFAETLDEPSELETDAKAWKNKAFKLYEQQTIDRDTIQSLRAIIIEMSQTLHVADPSARISMTSHDLLDLVHSQNDMSDNAF